MSAPTMTIRAELLDCIQANLAVLADRFHGQDAYLALGSALRFRPRPGPGGLPTVEPAMAEQVPESAGWLGMAVRATWHDVPSAELRDLVVTHGPLYVVADAYHLSWVPYFGRKHLEHSFLVDYADGRAAVTDAYHNHTQWGLASPGQWFVDWPELPAAMLVAVLEPVEADPPKPRVELESPEEYLAAYAQHPDRVAALERLAVETWLLARSRRLHAAFLGRDAEEHLARWDRMAEQTFLALRRVQRGRAEPERLLPDLAATLAADAVVFGLRGTVAEVVAGVFGTDVDAVLAADTLSQLRGFNSFRVVDVVERLEERLAVEFDPEDLVPENLHHLDDLCRLAAKAGR